MKRLISFTLFVSIILLVLIAQKSRPDDRFRRQTPQVTLPVLGLK